MHGITLESTVRYRYKEKKDLTNITGSKTRGVTSILKREVWNSAENRNNQHDNWQGYEKRRSSFHMLVGKIRDRMTQKR